MGCLSKTGECILSKYFCALIITIVAFVLFSYLFQSKSQYNKEKDDYNFSVNNSIVHNFHYNTTTTTFTYNLILFVIVPNHYVSLDYVNTTASYLNLTFASKPEETLDQGFTGLRMHFNGERVLVFTKDQLSTLEENHMAGLYNITVRIWPSNMMKYEKRIGPAEDVVLCDIQVPHKFRVSCGWTTDD